MQGKLARSQFGLEAMGFDMMTKLIQTLGVDEASGLSGRLWRLFAPYNKRDSRARANLAASIPTLSPAEIDACINGMWDNLGRTTAEAFHMPTLLAEEDRFTIAPGVQEAIRAAKTHGAVFVSLHLGNWELAAPLAAKLGLPVAGVYQRIRNPIVDARITTIRARHYPQGLYPKGHETARRLLKTISEGGTATIMADLRDLTGVPVPFFGREAPSTLFPALLARGRNVPLFAGAIFRVEGATFRVDMQEIPVLKTQDREHDLRETTAHIQAVFETFIRQAPGQWMWGHRRWAR
jgi:Kdo2-lipid IVA lauroyltransferase/acyltransferase